MTPTLPSYGCWSDLMIARLTEHEDYLDDRETPTAILNSQIAVAYDEIRHILRKLCKHN